MVSIITIILFFLYTWCFGYSLTFFLKNSNNNLERNLMRVGIGLGVIPIFGVILNAFRIPIDWKVFFVISLIVPVYSIIKNKYYENLKAPVLKLTKTNINILIVLVLFLLTLFMYEKGAFAYPYLEDDDPWGHANSIKYISIEKTAYEPEGKQFFQYIDPYPPGYGILFAILHQTSLSIMWTMKFFNALIISLGAIFFYFFAKEFTGSRNKALFSTFILAMIPCYLSHFIWAHSLAVTLFFPAMYCLERIETDRKWIFPSASIISSILVVQPTQAIKIGILLGTYFIIKSILEKKFLLQIFLAQVLSLLISLFWWYNKWSTMFGEQTSYILASEKYSQLRHLGIGNIISKIRVAFPNTGGTATRAYNFNDFFIAKSQNMINNPIGIGVILSLLFLVSLAYIVSRYKNLVKKENSWILTSLVWFLVTFLLVNSMTFNLPIGIFAFRTWMLMAIPIALLGSEGIWFLIKAGKKIGIPKLMVFGIIILGVFATSGYQKYKVNTATWGPGGSWTSMEEMQGYVWLKGLPADRKVFPLSGTPSFSHVIGFDKFACLWCAGEIEFGEQSINKSASEIHSWLKRKDYEYLVIDGFYVQSHGINESNEKISELVSSGLFRPVHQTGGAIVMKVS